MSETQQQTKPIWDLPTRVGHWLLVVLILFSWWSAENGQLQWHRWSGYTVLAVLLFRLYWGFFGASTARFARFVRGPATFFQYARTVLKRPSPPSMGHNPMGGWSVVVLLALIATQVGLGLFAEDTDGLDSGPLSYLVSYDAARWAAEIHEEMFNVLLAFIALHVAAVLFYQLYKKDNVIVPMLTGRKAFEPEQHSAYETAVEFVPWWRAVVGLALVVLVVWWIVA